MKPIRLFAIVLALIVLFCGCRHKPVNSRIGKSAPVTYITALSGSEFDIKLADGERIHALLPVGAPPQAKEKVTKLMNTWVAPQVVFLGKVDKGWVVDLKFGITTCTGTMCSLSDESLVSWLRKNGLAWE